MTREATEAYLQSIRQFCPRVTAEELAYLEAGTAILELRPKQPYLQAGDVQQRIGYVHSGLLRSFYVDREGNEITVNFIRESGYATHYSNFLTQSPSKYGIQSIEPSILVELPYRHIQEGYDRYPGLERYGRLIAEEVLKAQQRRIEGFLFGSAEARYLEFVQDNPDLFQRISLSHLSSYLGVERQSLSRIRKRLASGSL